MYVLGCSDAVMSIEYTEQAERGSLLICRMPVSVPRRPINNLKVLSSSPFCSFTPTLSCWLGSSSIPGDSIYSTILLCRFAIPANKCSRCLQNALRQFAHERKVCKQNRPNLTTPLTAPDSSACSTSQRGRYRFRCPPGRGLLDRAVPSIW